VSCLLRLSHTTLLFTYFIITTVTIIISIIIIFIATIITCQADVEIKLVFYCGKRFEYWPRHQLSWRKHFVLLSPQANASIDCWNKRRYLPPNEYLPTLKVYFPYHLTPYASKLTFETASLKNLGVNWIVRSSKTKFKPKKLTLRKNILNTRT
jgi:hypothetical protein